MHQNSSHSYWTASSWLESHLGSPLENCTEGSSARFPRLVNGLVRPAAFLKWFKESKTALKYYPQWLGTMFKVVINRVPQTSPCLLQAPVRMEKHSWLGKVTDLLSLIPQINLVEGDRKKRADICWELSFNVLCLILTATPWVEIKLIPGYRREN